MMAPLWDMHVHLDFMLNPRAIADAARTLGLGMFAVTVTPGDYEAMLPILGDAENVRLGVGLHPWWIADGRCGLDDAVRTAELVRSARYVGEIGLDASPKHVPEGSLSLQAEAFEIICRACAEVDCADGPVVLSIHAVKAAGLALDILERTGCIDRCRCIFHWFTGSSDELNRAVRSGCYFSLNRMMLATRRGREYARQLPADRLLLETDLPPGRDVPFTPELILESLENALASLESIRGADLRSILAQTARRLMG